MDFESFIEKAVVCSIFALVVTLVIGALFIIVMTIITPPVWQYCTIQRKFSSTSASSYYDVEAVVDWGQDVIVGTVPTLEEAQALAAVNNCPIKN